jgi:predicted transcriptional regulator
MLYKNTAGVPREIVMQAALKLRENYGMTQAEVASLLGCSQATVSLWQKEVRQLDRIATSSFSQELVDSFLTSLDWSKK